MTLVAVCLFIMLVLTVTIGWRYIDSIEQNKNEKVYERGWAVGYDVGVNHGERNTQDAWNAGYDFRKKQEADEKKPVKKKAVKKISTKEN